MFDLKKGHWERLDWEAIEAKPDTRFQFYGGMGGIGGGMMPGYQGQQPGMMGRGTDVRKAATPK